MRLARIRPAYRSTWRVLARRTLTRHEPAGRLTAALARSGVDPAPAGAAPGGWALAQLRQHPRYRLIVDLRENGGGDSEPFLTLINGIRHDPAINRPGRIFGLIDWLTDSSATLDAQALGQETHALLMGQQVEDPIDEYGDNGHSFKLPNYGITVQYTTKVVNPTKTRLGIPDIRVAPTLHDLLAGIDPVLTAAFAYGRKR